MRYVSYGLMALVIFASISLVVKGLVGEPQQFEYGAPDVLAGCILLAASLASLVYMANHLS